MSSRGVRGSDVGAPVAPPAFEVAAATVVFDGTNALDSIDLRIDAGSFVAILGPNGCGKTTLMRSLLGLQPLTSGRVLIHGDPLPEFDQWHRIGFVPQHLPAPTGVPISALEMVTSGAISPRTRLRRRGRAVRTAALEALDVVGLAGRRHARLDVLSGGQQRLVMIARALAAGADTLVLDEPMAGVDLVLQQRLADVLAELRGRTIVMVLHGLGPVTSLVTRAVVLESGRVVHDGPTAPEDWADHSQHSDRPSPPTILGG